MKTFTPMSSENTFRFSNHWNLLLIQKLKFFMKRKKRKERKEWIQGLRGSSQEPFVPFPRTRRLKSWNGVTGALCHLWA